MSTTTLTRIGHRGWTDGLANLTRKEFGQWWSTKLWLIQVALWVFMLDGISFAIMSDTSMTDAAVTEEAVRSFPLIAATAVVIGVILTVQGAVVGEREMGTAAWVMSKPASRASFIVSKLAAHSFGFLATAIVIPTVVFAVEAAILLPLPVSYGAIATSSLVLGLAVVFYVTLTLALGTMFRGRGPVAGIGIGLVLAGQFFKGMLPIGFVKLTPWLLGDIAGTIAVGQPLESSWFVPVVVTAAATVALLAIALRRFNSEEL
jgi:ABC-2 type transport system permease protein